MKEIQVTWIWAIKIWWSWCWRALAWTIPSAFLFGFLGGIVIAVVGVDLSEMIAWFQLVGICIGIFFGIFTLKTVLSKKFNGYRLAIIKTATDEESD